jgi:hypothetical protein
MVSSTFSKDPSAAPVNSAILPASSVGCISFAKISCNSPRCSENSRDRIVQIEKILGVVFVVRSRWIAVFRARKLAGLAIYSFFAGVNGYPFFFPNPIFHGDTIRISM